MTAAFSITLAVVAVLVLLARFVLPQLPVKSRAVRLSSVDAVLLGVGALGLAFHCTAMFSRRIYDATAALKPLVGAVNSMGVTSVVLFVVPALLILIGLRHQQRGALAALGLTLIAVGVTMYVGGPFPLHLASIFAATVVLVGLVSLFVMPPWRARVVD
ncbi:MAG: hypothetical protein V4531_13815 [Actinomycetota bacterium]